VECSGIRIAQFDLLVNKRGKFFGIVRNRAPQLVIG